MHYTIGACDSFVPSIRNFLIARERLVRPHEAAPVARVVDEIWHLSPWSYAEATGVWMQEAFRLGILRYIPDPPGECDFWCSPRSVLERGGEDCDGLAVLATSIILAGGFPAMLRVGRYNETGHAWCEGVDDGGPFLLEATSGEVLRTRPRAYVPIGPVSIE